MGRMNVEREMVSRKGSERDAILFLNEPLFVDNDLTIFLLWDNFIEKGV